MSKVVVSTELVTPAIAQQWINVNPCNRSLREGRVEALAADMRADAWTTCTMPIAFYEDGELADGQHRLYAIVETGLAQTFIVIRGLSRAAGLNIDTGLTRTLVDNARISGSDSELSNTLISVARACEFGDRGNPPQSNAARIAWISRHREACQWAIKHGPIGKQVRSSVTLAAVARAWYVEEDHAKLARFCEVLSGEYTEGRAEVAALSLRNWLVLKQGIAFSAAQWRDTFLKIQNAIAYFMRGSALTNIKVVSDEAYPLNRTKPLAPSRYRDGKRRVTERVNA